MTGKRNERCDIEIEPGRTIKLVPEANAEHLNEQQHADYRDYRHRFIDWMRVEGKNPEKAEGYSDYTAYESAYRTARFDRWAWEHGNGYSVPPAPELATEYVETDVVYRDVSNATKGKTEEALMRYYRYLETDNLGCEWEHDQKFTSSGDDSPRDFLTMRERRLVREAALDTGSWREATIVLTCLDAALRPVEVGRARTEWVDTDNMLLRIPKEDSSKNTDNWRTTLTNRTADALDHWLDERDGIEMYDDTDALWLTREGTKYSSRSLARLLRRLCDDAGIETRGRKISAYSIRHSTGTFLTADRDLKAAKDQLRHKTPKTTMKYDQIPPSQIRGSLERM